MTLEQLPAQDTECLARSVQVAYNGALLTWALEPEGPVEDRVRDEIATVLSAAASRGASPRRRRTALTENALGSLQALHFRLCSRRACRSLRTGPSSARSGGRSLGCGRS
jgi:hypothetical protein